MKRIYLVACVLLLMPCLLHAVPIVNNVGTSSEDSITVSFLNLLPSGNPASKLDSVWIHVFKSNANDIIFRDSAIGVAMTGIDSMAISGGVSYYFHRAVADIDGAGASGIYSYMIMATEPDSSMRTMTIGQFQIVGWELDNMGDSSGIAAIKSGNCLDTLQSQDGWVSHQTTSDSLYDTLKNHGTLYPTNFSTLSINGSGDVGIDLDNVTGTLSDAEIATIDVNVASISNNVITTLSINDGAITDAKVATIGVNIVSANASSIEDADIATIGVNVISMDADAIGVGDIATGAIDADALNASAASEICNTTWGHVADTAWAAGTLGDSAKGWGATSAADNNAMAQAFWGYKIDTAWTAGSFGDSAKKWTQTSDLTNAAIDKFWEYAQASITSATGIGYLIKLNQSRLLDTTYAIIDSLQAGVTAHDATSSGKGLLTYSGGTDSTLLLKRCIISGANGLGQGSLEITNTNGHGVIFRSTGSDGYGLYAYGHGLGVGILAYGGVTNAAGFYAGGQGTGAGIWAHGGSSNSHGFYADGHGTGDGINAYGGTNGDGLSCYGSGTGHDINLTGTGAIHGTVVIQDTTNSGKGLLTYSGGTDSTLLLKRCVISGANGAGGSFQVLNSSGDGVIFGSSGNGGDGLYAYGNLAGNGIFAYGGNTSGSGIYALGQGGGSGIYAYAGSAGNGLSCKGLGAGHDIELAGNADIHGFIDSCDASGLGVNSITATAIASSGAAEISDSVWLKDTSDVSTASKIGILMDAKISDAGGVASISDADMAAIADSVWRIYGDTTGIDSSAVGTWFKGNVGSGNAIGTGAGTLKYYARDTANSADLSVVNLTIRKFTGEYDVLPTGSAGYISFAADSSDSFIVTGLRPGYVFETDTCIMATWDQTDSLLGYSVMSDNRCRVYIYATDIGAGDMPNVRFSAQLMGRKIEDTCTGTWIANYEKWSSRSNSVGYAYIDLVRSSCMDNSTKYQFTVEYGGEVINLGRLAVPDSSSYRLTKH